MTAKRFNSKIDTWLLYLLIAVMVFEVVVMTIAAIQMNDPLATTALIVTALLILALIGSLLTHTYYSIDGNTLKIVSGPFRWKVPIDQIHKIKATRNPLSSPALSLDRLRIEYGNKRAILVSPADKSAFLKAVGHELSD